MLNISHSVIMNCPIDRAFDLWEIEASHWVMDGPLGDNWGSDVEILDVQPNKRIAWNSVNGDIHTTGSVTFNALGPDATQATVQLSCVVPADKREHLMAHMLDKPQHKLAHNLNMLKNYVEQQVHVGV